MPRFLAKAELWSIPWAQRDGRRPAHPVRAPRPAPPRPTRRRSRRCAGARSSSSPGGDVHGGPAGWPMKAKNGIGRIALVTGAPAIPVANWGTQAAAADRGPRFFPRNTVQAGPALRSTCRRGGRPRTGTALDGGPARSWPTSSPWRPVCAARSRRDALRPGGGRAEGRGRAGARARGDGRALSTGPPAAPARHRGLPAVLHQPPGVPAGQHVDRVGLGGARLRGEDGEHLAGDGVDVRFSNGSVTSPMSGCRKTFVPPRWARTSPPAQRVRNAAAAGGQLTDQLDQLRVIGVAAGLDPQHGHRVARDPLPLGEQAPGPAARRGTGNGRCWGARAGRTPARRARGPAR